jgi:hypothetical protein
MPGRLRIFISSTMEDLANERELIVDRLRSFNFECVNAEGMLPNGRRSWQRISEELDSSHLLILILGDRYGWIPTSGPLSDQNLSVTHGEYLRARQLSIPVLPFFKRLSYSGSSETEDAKRRDLFRREVGEWEGGQFRAEFDRALDLAQKVASAVTALLSDHFQRTAVQNRMDRLPVPPTPAPTPVPIPEGLLSSIRNKETLLFAGSGISLAAGLPSMSVFAAQFLRLIRQRVPGYEPSVVGTGFASTEGIVCRDRRFRRLGLSSSPALRHSRWAESPIRRRTSWSRPPPLMNPCNFPGLFARMVHF